MGRRSFIHPFAGPCRRGRWSCVPPSWWPPHPSSAQVEGVWGQLGRGGDTSEGETLALPLAAASPWKLGWEGGSDICIS